MQKTTPNWLLILLAVIFIPMTLTARQWQELKEKVTDDQLRPLAFATVKLSDGSWSISTISRNDGSFSIGFSPNDSIFLYSLQISYVGKTTHTSRFTNKNIGTVQFYKLLTQNLKLQEVEVNGVRKARSGMAAPIVWKIRCSVPLTVK